jgi:phospholipid/cholesterol/gamma-HCH transport system substrate-binding protein
MTPRRRNVIVGVVVLGSMITLGWMILQFSNQSAGSLFNKGMEFQIVADRVDGVSEGTPITYLGVNVGRVTVIRRVAGKREVMLGAMLNEGEQVPANVSGVIRPQSALGPSATISFELKGDPAQENLTKESVVKAHHTGGGVIPPEFGDLAKDISEQQLVAHATEAVKSLKEQLDRAGKTLDSVNDVLADPKVRSDLKATVANIHETSQNIERFSKKLDKVADETSTTLAQVRTTVDGGGKRFDEVARELGGRLTQMSQTLERVNSVATKIDKGQGTAGLFINDPRLYESFVDTARELNLTVADLRRLVQQWEEEGFRLKL